MKKPKITIRRELPALDGWNITPPSEGVLVLKRPDKP
jgi:hypothetical protein